MRGRSTRRGRRALLLATFLFIMTGHMVSARVETTPDPPDDAEADVAVRGIVQFPAGTYQWRVLENSLVAGDPPSPAPEPAALLLVDHGTVDLDGALSVRLTAGEAAIFTRTGQPPASMSTDTAAGAGYWMLQIYNVANSGGPGATGESFTVDQGPREVHLVRHALDAGEEVPIADQEVPVLVLATDGSVRVASSDGGESAELAAGGSNTFDGDLAFANAGDAPAAFVAAVVGPVGDGPAAPTTAGATTPAPAPAPTATQPPTTLPGIGSIQLAVGFVDVPEQVDASESSSFSVTAEVMAPNGEDFEGYGDRLGVIDPPPGPALCSFNGENPLLARTVRFTIDLDPSFLTGDPETDVCTITVGPNGQFVSGEARTRTIRVVP